MQEIVLDLMMMKLATHKGPVRELIRNPAAVTTMPITSEANTLARLINSHIP